VTLVGPSSAIATVQLYQPETRYSATARNSANYKVEAR
jgi:hypothetical protein